MRCMLEKENVQDLEKERAVSEERHAWSHLKILKLWVLEAE